MVKMDNTKKKKREISLQEKKNSEEAGKIEGHLAN